MMQQNRLWRWCMAILVDKNSRIICQGITGKAGSFHSHECLDYGTKLVGGDTPGNGGQSFEGQAIFDSVKEAVSATNCDVSMIFVTAPYAAHGILDAEEARTQLG